MKRRGLTWEGRHGGGGAMGVTHGMADCRGNCGVTGACVKSDCSLILSLNGETGLSRDEIDLTLRRVRDSDPSRELRLPDMVLRRGDGLAAANAPSSSASRCACSNGRACTADPVAVLAGGASAGWTEG